MRGAGCARIRLLSEPDGRDKTFAELPREVKCTFSHRARAAERMRPLLRSLFPAVAS